VNLPSKTDDVGNVQEKIPTISSTDSSTVSSTRKVSQKRQRSTSKTKICSNETDRQTPNSSQAVGVETSTPIPEPQAANLDKKTTTTKEKSSNKVSTNGKRMSLAHLTQSGVQKKIDASIDLPPNVGTDTTVNLGLVSSSSSSPLDFSFTKCNATQGSIFDLPENVSPRKKKPVAPGVRIFSYFEAATQNLQKSTETTLLNVRNVSAIPVRIGNASSRLTKVDNFSALRAENGNYSAQLQKVENLPSRATELPSIVSAEEASPVIPEVKMTYSPVTGFKFCLDPTFTPKGNASFNSSIPMTSSMSSQLSKVLTNTNDASAPTPKVGSSSSAATSSPFSLPKTSRSDQTSGIDKPISNPGRTVSNVVPYATSRNPSLFPNSRRGKRKGSILSHWQHPPPDETDVSQMISCILSSRVEEAPRENGKSPETAATPEMTNKRKSDAIDEGGAINSGKRKQTPPPPPPKPTVTSTRLSSRLSSRTRSQDGQWQDFQLAQTLSKGTKKKIPVRYQQGQLKLLLRIFFKILVGC
jgi:hypothetical protein